MVSVLGRRERGTVKIGIKMVNIEPIQMWSKDK